jgi:hypothetical protein
MPELSLNHSREVASVHFCSLRQIHRGIARSSLECWLPVRHHRFLTPRIFMFTAISKLTDRFQAETWACN